MEHQSKKGKAQALMKISESKQTGEEIEEMKLQKSPGASQAYKILQIEQIPSIEKLPSKSSQSNKESSTKDPRESPSGTNDQQFPSNLQ